MGIIKSSGYKGYLPIETLGEGDPKTKVIALLAKLKKAMMRRRPKLESRLANRYHRAMRLLAMFSLLTLVPLFGQKPADEAGLLREVSRELILG